MNELKDLVSQDEIPLGFTGVVFWRNGNKSWYLNKILHRENGPAIEYVNGSKEWLLNGIRHRVGGPAIEHLNGSKEWYLNGRIHRVDGPAADYASGHKQWWFEDKHIFNNRWILNRKGNYVVLERGIPTDIMFGNLKLTLVKLLTAEGTAYIYDNLPGLIIGEGNE
jgi:hypothetical protein